MRLSMGILADWLKKYSPKISIQSGKRQIRNVRPFSEEHSPVSGNVYVSQLSEISGGGIICINDNDFIYIPHGNVEDVINDIMDAFDYYNSWADSISDYSLSVQDILDKSQKVFSTLLMAADSSYYVLAYSGFSEYMEQDSVLSTVRRNNIMDMDIIKKIEKNPMIRVDNKKAYLQEEDYYSSSPLTRNLFVDDNHMGWILSISKSHTQGEFDLLDELGDILENWFGHNIQENDISGISSVFMEILEGSSDKNRLLNRLNFTGIDMNTPKYIYVTNFGEHTSGYAGLHQISTISDGAFSFIYKDQLITVTFLDDSRQSEFIDRINTFITHSKGRCGSSPVFSDIFEMKKNYILARAACELSPDYGITLFNDIALKYAESVIIRNTDRSVIHPALEKLKQYDTVHNSNMYDTLRVYLFNERNLADTARDLFIHRNSLLYRVSRIEKIIDADLNDPDIRLHIMLSFHLDSM